mmetsp:Transcript_5669/g.14746  ORF Transcript_5669/g.14746 Transcript_5669/m.14746 type:complete len:333 (-) Transcript_5669:91-1089(-)
MGDSITPCPSKPTASTPATTASTTSCRTCGSFTTPPEATLSLPASNCGFTSTTIRPPMRSTSRTAGITLSTEMKERSSVTMSTLSGRSGAVRCRRLVFSMTTRRGSCRSFSATCPRPTSTPYTRAAPCCNRQSVKPPVDRPASSATFPATSISHRWKAASSLVPARHTYFGTDAMSSTLAPPFTCAPALCTGCPSTSTLPCRMKDCTTFLLYSGWSSHTRSSSRWRFCLGGRAGPAPGRAPVPAAATRLAPRRQDPTPPSPAAGSTGAGDPRSQPGCAVPVAGGERHAGVGANQRRLAASSARRPVRAEGRTAARIMQAVDAVAGASISVEE